MIKQENLQKTNLRHGLLTGGKDSSTEAFILNIYLECYGRNKGECSVFDKKNLVLHNHYGLRLSSTQSKIILPYSQNLQMQCYNFDVTFQAPEGHLFCPCTKLVKLHSIYPCLSWAYKKTSSPIPKGKENDI